MAARIEALLAEGRAHLEARRYAEAIAPLKGALEASPTNADVAFLLARAFEGAGQLTFARRAYLVAARFAPTVPRPAVKAAQLLVREGHFERAARLLRKVVARFPHEWSARADLVRLELGLGHGEAARDEALAFIAAAEPKAAARVVGEANLLAGLSFLLLSKATWAEKHLLEARRLVPESVEAWVALASLKQLQRDVVKAERILLEARERFPKAFGPANDLGLLYLRKKKPTLAIPHLEAAALNEPANLDVYLNLALAWKPTNAERALWCARKAAGSKTASVRTQAGRLIEQLTA